MSYTVSAYLVDLARLRAAYGSHDDNLVSAIQTTYADDIASQDAEAELDWDDDDESEPLMLGQALQDIIDGTLRHPDQAHQYGYALELLCMYVGESLPNDAFSGLHGSGMTMSFVVEMDGLHELDDGKGPLPIPELPAPDDFPGITYLTSVEAGEILARFSVRVLENANPAIQTWAAEVQEQYRAWLQAAVHRHMDIIAFLY